MKILILLSYIVGLLFATQVYSGTATYIYDNLGRVTKVTYSNGKSITYTYDSVGNRITVISAG